LHIKFSTGTAYRTITDKNIGHIPIANQNTPIYSVPAKKKINLGIKEEKLHKFDQRKNNKDTLGSYHSLDVEEIHRRDQVIKFIETRWSRHNRTGKINGEKCLQELAGHLVGSLKKWPNIRQIKIDTRRTYMDRNLSTPLGLILYELMSNSLQHGFPDKRKGEISISLHSVDDGRFLIIYKDDGIGLPRNFSLKNSRSPGFIWIRELINRINGNITWERAKSGTVYSISC